MNKNKKTPNIFWSIITESSQDKLKGRFEQAEKRVIKLEDRIIEISVSQEWKGKMIEEK